MRPIVDPAGVLDVNGNPYPPAGGLVVLVNAVTVFVLLLLVVTVLAAIWRRR